ncbi:MAG TPA: hypothetical protein PLV84_11730, partial [Deltaproteobacteria bacterium]|nr:hypothetical protein [Deltaproteobacteria bacterium]
MAEGEGGVNERGRKTIEVILPGIYSICSSRFMHEWHGGILLWRIPWADHAENMSGFRPLDFFPFREEGRGRNQEAYCLVLLSGDLFILEELPDDIQGFGRLLLGD